MLKNNNNIKKKNRDKTRGKSLGLKESMRPWRALGNAMQSQTVTLHASFYPATFITHFFPKYIICKINLQVLTHLMYLIFKIYQRSDFLNRIINWETYVFHWDTYQRLANLQWSFSKLKTWRKWMSAVFPIRMLKSRWCRMAKDWRRRKHQSKSALLIHIITNHSRSRFLSNKYRYEKMFCLFQY